MGVDTRAVIVVGYTYDEIHEVYAKWEESTDAGDCHFYEWCEDNDLAIFSPYYDASYGYCLFGVEIDNSGRYLYSPLYIDDVQVQSITKDLTDKFGVVPIVYLSPNVT